MELDNDDTDADYVPDKDELQDSNESTFLSNQLYFGNVSRTQNRDIDGPYSRPRRSVVWQHYDRYSRYKAICNYCQKSMSYRSTVTNLKRHLEVKHPQALNDSEPGQKYSKPMRGAPRRSETWKYFKVSKEDPTRAHCKMCQQNVAYTNSSNLHYHLMKQHSRIDTPNMDTSDEGKRNLMFKAMKRGKRSEAWKYFEIKNAGNKIAICKVCRRDISYSTVSNLMKHMLRKHGRAEFKAASSDNESDRDGAQVEKSKRESRLNQKPQQRFRSITWKYFSIKNGATKVAQCKLCQRDFAYTTISNLRKHLMRKHQGVVQNPMTDDEVEQEVEEAEIDTSSPVWAYFRCLDERLRIASCLICKKRINYSYEADLKRHLGRKHPQVDLERLRDQPKKLMITGNGDIYEVDDDVPKEEPDTNQEDNESSDDWTNHNEEIDALHSTEFLDETTFDETECVIPKNRKHSQPSHKHESKEESSLDIFGRYMASLLKTLPKNKSDRLQVEFVRQIMEAQLTDQNNSYKSANDQNICYNSQDTNTCYAGDDTRVSSNSEMQRVVVVDGDVQHLVAGNEQVMVTSVAGDIILEN